MWCLQDQQLALHLTGLPLTAKPLIDAGLLFDDEGQFIRGSEPALPAGEPAATAASTKLSSTTYRP